MATRALHVTITGDPRGFQAALAKAGASTSAFAAKQKSTSAKVATAGRVMTKGITVPLIAAAAVSVKFAADFEKQMSSLGAVTDASAARMDAFRKQALKAGADTAFSASEAAQAQIELAKGGVKAADILSGALDGALALAAAGELELAEAAEITSNALNLFGMKGSEATHVADAMATAANSTTADVADFGAALGQAGSVAKSAGLSFDETMVALEALAANGIKGSDAGTSLKTSLIQLLKPTEKQADLANELGLSFIDQAGNMKSLGDISGMLRGKLGGMTKAQRTATLATLAGTDGVRTLTALYDAGPKALEKFAKGLSKQGTAAEVAERKQDNLLGKLEQLKGSLETLAIIVGSVLIPPLTDLAVHATQVANTIGAAFQSMPPQMQEVAMALAGVLAALGPLLWIGAKVAAAIGAIAGIGISATVLAIAAAVAALAVGLVIAYKRSEEFRRVVDGAFSAIKDAAGDAIEWLTTAVPAAFEAIKATAGELAAAFDIGATWETLKATLAAVLPLLTALAARFMQVVSIVRGVVTALAPILGPMLKAVFDTAVNTVRGAVGPIGQAFRGVLTIIRGVVQALGGLLRGDFGAMWAGVKAIFSGALSAIAGLVRLHFNMIVNLAKLGMRGIAAAIKGGASLAKSAMLAVVNAVVAVIRAQVNVWRTVAGTLVRAFAAGIRAVISDPVGAARAVAQAIIGAVMGFVGAARGAGSALGNAVAAGIRALVGAAVGAARALAQGAVNAISAAVGAAGSAAKAIGSAVISALGSFVGQAFGIGQAIIMGMVDGIRSAASAAAAAAADAAKGALNAAKDAIVPGSPSKVTTEYGKAFSEGLAKGITDRAYMAKKAAASVSNDLIFALESQIVEAEKAGEALQEAFARQDAQAEIAAARRQSKKGGKSKDDKRARAEARRELKDLQKDAARAQRLAKIELKVEGLQKLSAFNNAVRDIRDSLGDLAASAAQAFRDMRESAIDAQLDASLLALDASFAGALARQRKGIATDPRVAELEAIRGRAGASDREAEDAEIADRMAKAKAKQASADDRVAKAQAAYNRVAQSGSQRLMDQAQRRLDIAKAAAAAAATGIAKVEADERKLADQRRAEQLEAEIDNARAIMEDRAAAQREGLNAEVAAFQGALNRQLQAEAAQLAERKQNYAQFTRDVQAMLNSIGLEYEPSAEQEAALSPGRPAAKGKPKKRAKHRASGGSVLRRLGEWTSVSELGAEVIERPTELFLPRGSRVTPASRSDERGGPLIGTVNIHEAQRLNEQALAERLGFALATRRS